MSFGIVRTIGIPLFIAAALFSCSPHQVRQHNLPPVELPDQFVYLPVTTTASNAEKGAPWWQQFEDPQLTTLIERALQDNFSLQAAWSRLAQAREQVLITGSARYPQLESRAGASRNRLVDPEIRGAITAEQVGTSYFNDYVVGNGLSFELNLWKRIASQRSAADYRARATRATVENTAIVLSGAVTDSWFRVQEQQALLRLLSEQIEVSQTLLELTELRFAVGRGSALDVYQQREQLAALRSEIPVVQSNLEQGLLQISTLVGQTPGGNDELQLTGELPALPAFPSFVTPSDLLELRPDLREGKHILQAAEYDLAAAFADRFPRLTVGLSYNFQASEFSDLFDRERGSIAGDILLPLIDGGRRRARVRQTEAIVEEFLAEFGNLYLSALQDVETALVVEQHQKELVERLDVQHGLAKATLRESRSRYVNGLSDYLDVIVALQALQRLERRIVSENRVLISSRARLYLALGGNWTKQLNEQGSIVVQQPPKPKEDLA